MYCLDTSVYTQAHRMYYSFDIAPNFWTALEDLANRHEIVSPLSVYSEIKDGNDELSRWALSVKETLFVDPDDKVITSLREIVEFANINYRDAHWIRSFLSGADPWVIAQAKANNLIVVTMESQKKNEDIDKPTGLIIGELKIPNICDHLSVKWVNTYDLLRKLSIRL